MSVVRELEMEQKTEMILEVRTIGYRLSVEPDTSLDLVRKFLAINETGAGMLAWEK